MFQVVPKYDRNLFKWSLLIFSGSVLIGKRLTESFCQNVLSRDSNCGIHSLIIF